MRFSLKLVGTPCRKRKTYSSAADNKVAPKQKEVTSRMAAETLKEKKEIAKKKYIYIFLDIHKEKKS